MNNSKTTRRRLLVIKTLLLIVAAALLFGLFEWRYHYFNLSRLAPQGLVEQRCVIEKVVLDSDKDADGICDLDDIVQGARRDLEARPLYKDAYYAGGYPPENEGVCTDVIWRALQNAGYDLKGMMDRDIQAHPNDYPRVAGVPEPNIDFRRVPNQEAFFKKYAEQLTTEIKPWDAENLKQWQGGDIVVLKIINCGDRCDRADLQKEVLNENCSIDHRTF